MNEIEAIERIELTNKKLIDTIKNMQFITEARIIYHNTQLVFYINLLYKRAQYNYLQGMFHASPGLWAMIATIVIFVSNIIIIIKAIIDILHIVEIIQIAELLRLVWPSFRIKYDEIMGKVAEISASLGFGADGLIHLIQSTQGGIALLGGVLGKDDTWSEFKIAEQAINVTQRIASFAHVLERNPSHALISIFREQDWHNKRVIKTWWDKTVDWMSKTTEKAENLVINVNDVIDNLQELENKLPQFIRDNIPNELFTGIRWLDEQIDNTILPAITNISYEFGEINNQLQAQRDKAQMLINNILNPGDLLGNIDQLTGDEKTRQELVIDDITSRIYESETDHIYNSDFEVIAGLKSVLNLASLDLPEIEFLRLETTGRPGIIFDEAEKVDGWFVGDY